jgi:arginase
MQIDVFGVPLDLGTRRRGTNLGPQRLRRGGLASRLFSLGHKTIDHGDVDVPPHAGLSERDPMCGDLDQTTEIAARICTLTRASMAEGRFPLVLGGDRRLTLGSIRGAAFGRKLGVIWIDAHADFNTVDTSLSGSTHGMPLLALTGLGDRRLLGVGGPGSPARAVDPAHIALVGVREVGLGERLLLEQSRVKLFTSEATARLGIEETIARAIAIASHGTDGIYLSIDLDGFDPSFAPGVSTPVPGGLTPQQGIAACHAVQASGLLVGMDVVELNPMTDIDGATERLALALVGAAVGDAVHPQLSPSSDEFLA